MTTLHTGQLVLVWVESETCSGLVVHFDDSYVEIRRKDGSILKVRIEDVFVAANEPSTLRLENE